MAAQNPIILKEDDLPADVWTKVATNVQRGFIHILKDDLVYYQTHRLTGEAAPDNEIAPDDPDFEGVPMFYRDERIAGENPIIGGDGINSSVPRDVYLYCQGAAGRVRVDIGEVEQIILPPSVGLPSDVFVVKPAGASSLLNSDENKWLEFQNGASDADLTIVSPDTLGWSVGSAFYASKTGSGELSFLRSGVTFLSPLGNADFKLDSDGTDGHVLLFIYRGSDTFYVNGPIKSI